MKTASMTLKPTTPAERTHKSRGYKPVDMMVSALGVTVALAGFFGQEITWALAGV